MQNLCGIPKKSSLVCIKIKLKVADTPQYTLHISMCIWHTLATCATQDDYQ